MEEKGLLGLAFNGDDHHGRPGGGGATQVSPELFKQGVIEHAVWLGECHDRFDCGVSCCLFWEVLAVFYRRSWIT